jgi:hypothetical protein
VAAGADVTWRTGHVPPQGHRRRLTAPRHRRTMSKLASSMAHLTICQPPWPAPVPRQGCGLRPLCGRARRHGRRSPGFGPDAGRFRRYWRVNSQSEFGSSSMMPPDCRQSKPQATGDRGDGRAGLVRSVPLLTGTPEVAIVWLLAVIAEPGEGGSICVLARRSVVVAVAFFGS